MGKDKFIIRCPPSPLCPQKAHCHYACENPIIVLHGLNMRDVALLKYGNIVDGQIVFYRQKTIHSLQTTKPIYIFISEDIQRIMTKWGNKSKGGDTYIFDILRPGLTAKQTKERTHSARKKINRQLRVIAKELGLKIVPTTAHARHSFSTVLKRAGVGIEMILEQLGHSNVKTTEIYLDSFEMEQRKEVSDILTSFRRHEGKQ